LGLAFVERFGAAFGTTTENKLDFPQNLLEQRLAQTKKPRKHVGLATVERFECEIHSYSTQLFLWKTNNFTEKAWQDDMQNVCRKNAEKYDRYTKLCKSTRVYFFLDRRNAGFFSHYI
jgi:hypothetical protein